MNKKSLLILATVCILLFVLFIPIETKLLPQWKLEVTDLSGVACSKMRVTETWGHYRLYLDGNYSREDRITDTNGYVQFPERTVRASLARRIVMPIITRITNIMHGGWRVEGAVWADGIKDVAWLSYQPGTAPPDKMRVEKCINDGSARPRPER
jgi:hypothetical protein